MKTPLAIGLIKNPNRSRDAGDLISWDFLILTGMIINRSRAVTCQQTHLFDGLHVTGYKTQLRNQKKGIHYSLILNKVFKHP